MTPVDTGVARPLIGGMEVETIVKDPSGMALFDIEPMNIDEAMKAALEERQERRLGLRCPPSIDSISSISPPSGAKAPTGDLGRSSRASERRKPCVTQVWMRTCVAE